MKKVNKRAVKIIPLGGLEQIGMNITAIEYEDSIIVIDCGLAFPEDDMLGIDLVIPDVTYLKENADKVKGLVVTHGHEDHIGAIPYIEKELNISWTVQDRIYQDKPLNSRFSGTCHFLTCRNNNTHRRL